MQQSQCYKNGKLCISNLCNVQMSIRIKISNHLFAHSYHTHTFNRNYYLFIIFLSEVLLYRKKGNTTCPGCVSNLPHSIVCSCSFQFISIFFIVSIFSGGDFIISFSFRGVQKCTYFLVAFCAALMSMCFCLIDNSCTDSTPSRMLSLSAVTYMGFSKK